MKRNTKIVLSLLWSILLLSLLVGCDKPYNKPSYKFSLGDTVYVDSLSITGRITDYFGRKMIITYKDKWGDIKTINFHQDLLTKVPLAVEQGKLPEK